MFPYTYNYPICFNTPAYIVLIKHRYLFSASTSRSIN